MKLISAGRLLRHVFSVVWVGVRPPIMLLMLLTKAERLLILVVVKKNRDKFPRSNTLLCLEIIREAELTRIFAIFSGDRKRFIPFSVLIT
jgi:hypothetical protein